MVESRKKRILFVDDESKVLNGLRRTFFDMEKVWDMAFAENGKQALELMAAAPFDAVVSDMRMPGISGAELLNEVKKQYPATVRFILSGYSDREMVMKTVRAADQFLTKPCSRDELIKALEKIFKVQAFIPNPQVRAMVSEMQYLPVLPEVYRKLSEVLQSDRASMKEVAHIISQDVVMTAKILQLVNSAFFGLRHQNYNLEHAVTFLGIETLKALVLVEDIFKQLPEDDVQKFHTRDVYRHSLSAGILSRKIAETLGLTQKDAYNASMAGIIHDFGKVILIKNMPGVYEKIYQEHQHSGRPFYELEEEIFDTTHAEIGGYLLCLWGLPDNTVKAVTSHHAPQQAANVTPTSSTNIVYVANMLMHETDTRDDILSERLPCNNSILQHLSIEKYGAAWRSIAAELRTNMDAFKNQI